MLLLEALITWLYTGVVLMIVGMIVYQILVIPLEMTYYILADKPELKSTEAMKRESGDDAWKLRKISYVEDKLYSN